ncbi:hypothetical protein ACODNH_05515 [Haloarcula sp. NS06]|uniref:hypothetical protein n=1 Tax=Haloarcula sp. NS06 TaxID=3409688 RepID=UPI003DA70FF2
MSKGDTYNVDDPGVPSEDGDTIGDAAAHRRGERLATVYLIDTGEENHVWPHGYPSSAEARDDWTVLTAWWHVDTARRRIA